MAVASRGGAPPARERLTREKLLGAALEFTDAHGLDALSLRKLAAELGVQPMSLYTHVDSKDALLDGLVEAMTAELQMPRAGESDWRAVLRGFAASLRDMVHRHPAAAPLLASRRVLTVHSLEVIDACLRVLRRAGFTEDRALEVLRVVHVYALGHALTEVSWGIQDQGIADQHIPDDDIARLRWVTGMVPRDAPDRLLRTALQYCARCDMNHQVDVGLDLIIHGLETECPGPEPVAPA